MNEETVETEDFETSSEETSTGQKSNQEIAKEVIAGLWSRGQNRRKMLQEAGYNPTDVALEVDKILYR